MSESVVHPPKVETFDLAAMTNTDPKGIVREVEEYREEPFGLYLARPTPGRTDFRYIESWLLPDLGLRVTDFWFNPGYERDQDFYLDIVEIQREGTLWRARDLYLDIVLRQSEGAEVIDTDELVDAVSAGLIEEDCATRALNTAFSTVTALAEHQFDLGRWFGTLDIRLGWRRH